MYYSQSVRLYNIARILDFIRRKPGISRSGLALEMGLDKSTVSSIVTGLLEAGAIHLSNEGSAGPSGGRKPVGLAIRADGAFYGGIELRPDRTTWSVLDLSGELVVSGSEPTLKSGGISGNLQQAAASILGSSEVIGTRVAGIGVGLPGIVDPDMQVLRSSIPLEIDRPLDIGKSLSKKIDRPVLVENDANCLAWGVLARGGGSGTFACVLIDTTGNGGAAHHQLAVGLGLCLDGRIHYGRDNSAGEFRSIHWDGGASQFSSSHGDAEAFSRDPIARSALLKELSEHLAFLVNTLNLEAVYFSGDAVIYRAEIRKHLTTAIQRNWSYAGTPGCFIGFEKKPEVGVATGAAGLVLSKTFSGEASTQNRHAHVSQFRLLNSVINSDGSTGRSA